MQRRNNKEKVLSVNTPNVRFNHELEQTYGAMFLPFHGNQLLPLGHQVPGKASNVLVFS